LLVKGLGRGKVFDFIFHFLVPPFVTTLVTLERVWFGIIVIVDMGGVGTTPEES
jgi:hypothetical protein